MRQLLAWQAKSGRKPLILRGVRQTGKTYLLTEFGEQAFANTHIINFEKQPGLKALFEADLEPRRIISDLSFQLGKSIEIETDLVIFDEIQACPAALTSLKYFCEDLPELALCSAGSLLGLHLNESSYPVGKVDMLRLPPMTFTEFLGGIGDHQAAEFVLNYELGSEISEIKHQHLWERLKQYFIVGGLPEAVKTFGEQMDDMYAAMQAVRVKQDELIIAYYADIAKHAGKVNAMHIDRTWQSVPMQLASNYDVSTSRFRFKDIIPGVHRYRQLVHVIDWLESAELVIKLPIVSAFEQPVSAYTKDGLFKLMLFDVGLLGAMSGIDPGVVMQYDFGTYKGYFAENFVGQQLRAAVADVVFTWQEDRSEIEFLLSCQGQIMPIEVKSGKHTRTKSLEKFINKYQPNNGVILSAKKPAYNSNKTVIQLPLYLSEKISSLLFSVSS